MNIPLLKAESVVIDFELTDDNIEKYRNTFDEETVVILHIDDEAISYIGGDLCDVLYDVSDELNDREDYDDFRVYYYKDVETKNYDGDVLTLLGAAAESYASVDERNINFEEKAAICFKDEICFKMEDNCFDEEISQKEFDELWNQM